MLFRQIIVGALSLSLGVTPVFAQPFEFKRVVPKLVITEPPPAPSPSTTPSSPVPEDSSSPAPGTGTPESPAAGRLQVSVASLSFGSLMVGQSSAVQTFLVLNTGQAALTLSQPTTTGDFSATTTCTSALPAGSSCSVSVAFVPSATGIRSGSARIVSAESSYLDVSLTGFGLAPMTVSAYGDPHGDTAPPLAFGAVNARTSSQALRTFYFKRAGNTGALLANAQLTGSPAFEIVSATKFDDYYQAGDSWKAETASCQAAVSATQVLGCQADLNDGQATRKPDIAITLRFKPQEAGAHSAQLQFAHNGYGEAPLVFDLSGTGTPVAVAQLSSSSLNFDNVQVGQPKELTVALTNVASATMTLSSAPAIVGAAAYSATTNCGTTLAVDQSCLTTVRLAPSTHGALSATKLLFSTNALNAPVEVTLTGTGTQALGSLTADTDTNFGTVEVGVSQSRSFTFRNAGNIALTGAYAQVAGSDLAVSSTTCGSLGQPVTLQPDETCSISVAYTPSAVASLSSASVSVVSQAINSPSSLALSGAGSAPVRALNISPAVGGRTSWDFAQHGNLVISSAGQYTISVSTPTTVSAKLWGGGGGAANVNYSNIVASTAKGGGGGHSSGNVVLQPGVTYILVVGSGGTQATTATAYGQGGGGKTGSRSNGGQGGGYTGLFSSTVSQANSILVAGGGGGASGDGPYVRPGTSGGGASVTGTVSPASVAGMAGVTATSTYSYYGSGGGGGGYQGGNAFAGYDYYGGTGGLGFVNSTLVSGGVSSASATAGAAANASDVKRPSGAGDGGRYPTASVTAGKAGAAVLY